MEIVNLKTGAPFPPCDCGLCLGSFDGVHLGHRALVRELKRLNAKEKADLPLGALTFKAPPSAYFSPSPVGKLTTLQEKLRLLRRAGLSFAVIFDFEEIKDLTPDDFVREILINTCRCHLAVCGFNYTYGKGGVGTAKTLGVTFGEQPGRTLCIVPPVYDGRTVISSSAIRHMLEMGHPEDAARLMGRPYLVEGKVKSGWHIGSLLGYPTANLDFPDGALIPAHGVYLSSITVGRRSYFGISNIGTRPTFHDSDGVNLETFLFDFHGDLYGKTLRVSLLRFLREERKFSSPEALFKQIEADIAHARLYMP